ncbi:hypothetical protein FPV67DRAFT_1451635 [Lyophyllum atratum]|nr:hypothetical protein FPV67DRAFT_1451635 [Lyophyllum atratum]
MSLFDDNLTSPVRPPTQSPSASPRRRSSSVGSTGSNDELSLAGRDASCSSHVPSDGLESHPPSTPQTGNRRKRRSEDITQFANSFSRRVRARGFNNDDLNEFAEMPGQKQSIVLAILLMRSNELVQAIQPVEAPYQISASLEAKIEKYAFVMLVDATIGAYIKDDAPLKLLVEFLQRYPGWGVTSQVAEDPTKLKVVVGKARDVFVTLRNLIKGKIEESIASEKNDNTSTDIMTLCQQIVSLRTKIAPKVKVSVQMCGRVAFLRKTFVKMQSGGKVGRDYWPKVDAELENIRVRKDNDATRISAVFTQILAEDRETHGRADVASLIADSVPADSMLDSNEAFEAFH